MTALPELRTSFRKDTVPSRLGDQKTPKKGQDTFSNLTTMPGGRTAHMPSAEVLVKSSSWRRSGQVQAAQPWFPCILTQPCGPWQVTSLRAAAASSLGKGRSQQGLSPRPLRGERPCAEAQAGAWLRGRDPWVAAICAVLSLEVVMVVVKGMASGALAA